MSRPRPLNNIASALPNSDEYASLTPRTPHSRTARLEGGFGREEDYDTALFTPQQQQSAPLLASSASDNFPEGLRSSRKNKSSTKEPLTRLSRVLLTLGVGLAGLLLVLIAISFKWPGFLEQSAGLGYSASNIHHHHKGHQGGPISYENYTIFPLTGAQFLRECQKRMSGFMAHGDYWNKPHGPVVDVEHYDGPGDKICTSTIIYMLDGNVGLAADLALMAQAAALAREQNRTFFVDDTYWKRGNWLDFFEDPNQLQPGPEPGCLEPPPEDLVACPRTARHWVINSLTAKYHFGHEFENHYEDAYGHQLNRAKPIFRFAAESFASAIRPNADMVELINTAKQELYHSIPESPDRFTIDDHSSAESTYVSVHIRRGDRIPRGWEHHRNPIPTKDYVDAVLNLTRGAHEEGDGPKPSVVYLASDSPSQIKEFVATYEGPTFSLAMSSLPELNSIASPEEYYQHEFDALPYEQRYSATKGAIVDLALVTGLWDSGRHPHLHSSVCSASSSFGRLAAFGLGWDKAFGGVSAMGEVNDAKKRWVDVDLKGHELPVWTAFELF